MASVFTFCVTCGRRFDGPGSRCAEHARQFARPKRKRPGYTYAERKRRKAAVDAHRAIWGDVCPGWNRPPHDATDLTADHITPVAAGGSESGPLQVYCRGCNSSKGARQ